MAPPRTRRSDRSRKNREAQEETIQEVPRHLRPHTPLSVEEKTPWKCRRLVIGTGTCALPVMKEVKQEAKRRKIKLLILPTARAIRALKENLDETNAILHITC
jgi:hypothetical protein